MLCVAGESGSMRGRLSVRLHNVSLCVAYMVCVCRAAYMSNKVVKHSRCSTRVVSPMGSLKDVYIAASPVVLYTLPPQGRPLYFSGKKHRGESWLVTS